MKILGFMPCLLRRKLKHLNFLKIVSYLKTILPCQTVVWILMVKKVCFIKINIWVKSGKVN